MIGRACLLASGALWFMGTGGCGGPNDDLKLFDNSPSQAGSTGSAGSIGSAGTSGSAGSEASAGSGGVSSAGSAGSAASGTSGAACALPCGDGGHSGGASGGGAGSSGASGAGDQAGGGSGLTDCSAFGPGATYLPSTKHCYLVVTELRTFTAAQTYCKSLGAHLVTLLNEAEDQFAWSLHSEEHWIGSKDGNAPKDPKVGVYSWVTGEPFEYSNWSWNQPDASGSECGESNGGGTCYEHCAFQWTGGEDDGEWNDRYCQHTIASLCEWDNAPER